MSSNITRRDLLKAGGVTAVGAALTAATAACSSSRPASSQGSSGDGTEPSDASHLFSFIGEHSQTGAFVSSVVQSGVPIDLAYSTSADLRDYKLLGAQPVSQDGIYHHDLNNRLTPGTQYYAQLYAGGGLFGRTLSFRTQVGDLVPEKLRVALVCCQRNSEGADQTQLGWHRLLEYDPDLTIHGGDYGYWGGHLTKRDDYRQHLDQYTQQTTQLAVMRRALESSCSMIQVSDHEVSSNDGNTYNDPVTAHNLACWLRLMPWRSFDDQTRRSRFLTRKLGTNIRIILTDFRSLDRSPARLPDDENKTAFGQHQFDLVVAALKQPEPLKVIVSDPGAAPSDPPKHPNDRKMRDKWSNYQAAYQKMVDVIRFEKTIDGKPILVDMWSGDRHMIGYTLERDNRWGPFDVITSSSIDQDALALEPGETYTEVYGNKTTKGQNNKVHVELDVTDDKDGTISRTARGVDNASGQVVFTTTRRWTYDA